MNCPHCGSFNDIWECFLGRLGDLMCLRCRYCGGEWHNEGEPPDEYWDGEPPDEYWDGEPHP